MKKRILTVLCALALLVGAFGIVAAAVDANAVAVIGNTDYSSLQAAVDAIEEGATGLIELKKSTDETVTVTCDVYVDLAGNSIAGIDVTAGTFYGMDSATIIEAGDDANVSYGKIASVEGAVKPISVDAEYSVDSYLMAEDNGTSFHAVNLRLTDMSLRAEKAGVYFKSDFAGDSVVASKVKKFGVALSIKGVPTAANIKTSDCARSSFTGFTAGVNNNATSTLLSGIMKEDNEFIVNKRNANTPVYGRAYVELKDGTFIFGAAQDRSLKKQVQLLATANEEVVEMYRTYKPIMKEWDNITAVNTAYQAAEDETLKILMIGNSHGQDSVWVLNEVFGKLYPDQKVVIGDLYHDGTPMMWHAYYARYDRGAYSYYKNYRNIACEEANADGSWSEIGNIDYSNMEATSVRYALQDEPWDIVVIQEMNTRVGVDNAEDDYHGWNANYYKFLCEFVLANADRVNGKAPLIGFNMMWANPDDDIYKGDRQPGVNMLPLNKGWSDNLQRLFPGADGLFETRLQYNAMTANVQEHLVGDQNQVDFMGKKYVDFILTPGTAVQYCLDALDEPMSQRHIYRDYTHMSYFGRIMAAHVWAAQIMSAYTGNKVTYTSVDQIIDGMPDALAIGSYKDAPYPALNEGTGVYELSAQDKANIFEAVQWTLEHNFSLPE